MSLIPLPPKLLAAFWHFYRRIEHAELDLIAAGVAFFGFLAIFPAAAAVIAIWGFVSDPSVIRQEVSLLRNVLPPDAFTLISDQVEALLAVNSRNLGLATLLSTLFAFWSARAGVAALIRGLNAIHHLPNRAGHRHQLRALLLTLLLMGLALAAMVMSVVMPLVVQLLPLGPLGALLLRDGNQVLGLLLAVLAVSLAYRMGPNHISGQAKPPLFSWGLLVAVVLWILAARGFMLYLANFPSYNRVYGSIGAVAALLMWLYVSAYAVLLGAAVDAERQRRPRDQ
jgi:membrane protein